jgi:acetyl-CoA/propionyl-CoA carboxylase biotin carboxyl carrier protein
MGTLMADVSRGPAPGELVVRDGDRLLRMYVATAGGTVWVFHDGVVYEIDDPSLSRGRARAGAGGGSLTAPMPATVVDVKVKAGDAVTCGDIVIVLEAMKMELPVRAPGDGHVTAVHCRAGQLVQPDTVLIEIA